MNEYDKENLRFLLECDPKKLHDWFNDQSSDDIDYAQSLLDAYAEELTAKSTDLLIAAMPAYPEANAVLSKIMKM